MLFALLLFSSSKTTFEHVIHLFVFISGQLCSKDLKGFENWRFNVSVDDESLLVATGEKELEIVGKRYRARLPSLFDDGYSKDLFKVSIHNKKYEKVYCKTTEIYQDTKNDFTLYSKHLQFVHTTKKRTFQSAKAFANGMFPEVQNIVADFQNPDNDLLRVNCILH